MDDAQLTKTLNYNSFLHLGTVQYGILIYEFPISFPTLLITYKNIGISFYA